MRLSKNPYFNAGQSKEIRFTYRGRKISCYEGESIAVALQAAGESILSRSFKYHRPRGLLCLTGSCPNCIMRVDGIPGIHTCLEKVSDGCKVETERGWPSIGTDIFSALWSMRGLFPAGFQYRRFIRPTFLWPLYERIIRRLAGLGRIPDAKSSDLFNQSDVECDIVVIGGGAAGISAALESASVGARVALIQAGPNLGGRLRIDTQKHDQPGEFSGMRGFEIAEALAKRVGESRIQVFSDTHAFGLYEGPIVCAIRGNEYLRIHARRIIICTGSREQLALFQNNDLPGIMLSEAVLRLIHQYRVSPGRDVVVLTSRDYGWDVARQLVECGVNVAALVDTREEGTVTKQRALTETKLYQGYSIIGCRGKSRVTATVVRRNSGGDETPLKCDTLCLALGFHPTLELLQQAPIQLKYGNNGARERPNENTAVYDCVYVAGDASEPGSLERAVAEGRLAGLEAAGALKALDKAQLEQARVFREWILSHPSPTIEPPLVKAKAVNRDSFVCLCEDVTVSDIALSIKEGYDAVETLKRFTAVGMGPCQGKSCMRNTLQVFASMVETPVERLQPPTSRPPAITIPLGALAAAKEEGDK